MIISYVTPESESHSGPTGNSNVPFEYIISLTRDEHTRLVELSREIKKPYHINKVLRIIIEAGLKNSLQIV